MGSFSASKSLLIDAIFLHEGTIYCEITLPSTTYKEIRWRKVPKLPMEFINSTAFYTKSFHVLIVLLSLLHMIVEF